MDAVMAFAAARRDRMNGADKDLGPEVRKALENWSAKGDWYKQLIEDASVLWLEFFEQEAPNADPDIFIGRFHDMLGEALSKTAKPSSPPTDAEVQRVTYWLSTATINNATYLGNRAHGGKGMRWVTMNDDAVRETHRHANGEVAGSDGTFDIGGFELHYPGEPVGPPEIWINCRCILVSARVEGALTVSTITAASTDQVVADDQADEMPMDEAEDGEDLVTEIPVHGVAAIEGKPTGDGRKFAVGAVEFGQMPQPIGYEYESGHGSDNSRVAIIGRADEFFKVDNGEYTEIRYRGVIFPDKPYASDAINGIIDGTRGGVSIIADSMALDLETTEADAADTADGHILTQTFSQVRVRRFDMVPTGAFQEAYIALGPEFPDEMSDEALAACAECAEKMAEEERFADEGENAFAPGTHDGPGWITHPIPTGRIRRYWTHGKGAAKIRWGVPGDFNRCRRQLAKYIANPDWLAGACANMHKEAIGIWPGQEAGGSKGSKGHHNTEVTAMVLTASADIAVKPAEAFRDPGLTGPTPITIEGGRIFGHLATWGVCHIGIQDTCVTAPHSNTGYAFYRTGVVVTDEGKIPVGQITMGTGHASIRSNAKNAVEHYDNTGTVVADVVAGEDSFGIWVAGMLRPNLTEEQVTALAASCLSGDWRRTAAGLELVAALAVNVPGFPVPRPALAASAVAEGEEGQRLEDIAIDADDLDAVYGISPVARDSITAGLFPSNEEIAGIVRTAVDEYRSAEDRQRRLAAIEPFYDEVRAEQAARIVSFFEED